METSLVRHRFTVEDYERMVRTGILTEEDRVELLEGEIIQMSPIGERHASCVKRLNRLLAQRLGDRAIVSVQDPIRLDDDSEPQPDLAILRPKADFYASGHPRPGDILFLIEVADTTQEKDRGVKIPLYARAGIPEVWLMDLEQARVEVYGQPERDRYGEVRSFTREKRLSPRAFADTEIPVGEILG